jgi:hypothetical protein
LMDDARLADGQNIAQSTIVQFRDMQGVLFAVPLNERHMRCPACIHTHCGEVRLAAFFAQDMRLWQKVLRKSRGGTKEGKADGSEHGV